MVGLAGLEGSGVSTLLGILFGTRKARAGDGRLSRTGADCRATPPRRRGAAYASCPADRRRNGLMLDKSVLFNISQVVVGARRNGLVLVQPRRGARAR